MLIKRILEHLRKHHMTRAQFAIACGIDRSQLYRYLTGKRGLTTKSLDKIFEYFDGPEASEQAATQQTGLKPFINK